MTWQLIKSSTRRGSPEENYNIMQCQWETWFMSSFNKSLEKIRKGKIKGRERGSTKKIKYLETIWEETEKQCYHRFILVKNKNRQTYSTLTRWNNMAWKKKSRTKNNSIYWLIPSYRYHTIWLLKTSGLKSSLPWTPSHQLFVEDSTIFLIVQKTLTPAQRHLAWKYFD